MGVLKTYSEAVRGAARQAHVAIVFVIRAMVDVEEAVPRDWIRHLKCVEQVRGDSFPDETQLLGTRRAQTGRRRRWRWRSHGHHFQQVAPIAFDKKKCKFKKSISRLAFKCMKDTPRANFVACSQPEGVAC